jgi:AraC-like DNA-binding protein
MDKRPKKQFIRTLKYDRRQSQKENFQNFLSFLDANGQGLRPVPVLTRDARIQKAGSADKVDYELTVCRTLGMKLIKLKAASLSLQGAVAAEFFGEWVQLVFVQQGAATLTSEGRTAELGRGQLLIKDPAVPHTLVCEKDCQLLSLLMEKKYFLTRTGRLPVHFLGHVLSLSAGADRILRTVVLSLYENLESIDPRDVESVCDGLLSLLRPALNALSREQRKEGGNPKDALRDKAKNAMAKHLKTTGTDLSLIASECGISTRYLSALFQEIGATPKAYWLQMRLEAAATYLSDPYNREVLLEDVARETGFCNVSHFCREFKKYFKQTPSAFRSKGKQ